MEIPLACWKVRLRLRVRFSYIIYDSIDVFRCVFKMSFVSSEHPRLIHLVEYAIFELSDERWLYSVRSDERMRMRTIEVIFLSDLTHFLVSKHCSHSYSLSYSSLHLYNISFVLLTPFDRILAYFYDVKIYYPRKSSCSKNSKSNDKITIKRDFCHDIFSNTLKYREKVYVQLKSGQFSREWNNFITISEFFLRLVSAGPIKNSKLCRYRWQNFSKWNSFIHKS